MPVSYRIDPESGIAIATCAGVIRLAESRAGAAALWNDAAWPGRLSVWDFRGASFDFSSSDVMDLARFVRENQPDPPVAKMAVITERSVDFGLARMFEAYRKDPRTEFRVFRDFDEALVWAKQVDPTAEDDG